MARFVTFVTDGLKLAGVDGRRVTLGEPSLAVLFGAAQMLAGDTREAIVWIPQPARRLLGLPDRIGPAGITDLLTPASGWWTARCVSKHTGWHVLADGAGADVHTAFPEYLGDFDGLTPNQLWRALCRWSTVIGFDYLFSGASTVHTMIRLLGKPGASASAPHVDYNQPSFADRRLAWCRPLDRHEQHAGRYVGCFDRSASYLAAWRGCVLGTGGWVADDTAKPLPANEHGAPAGYWLVDLCAVRASLDPSRPDPFLRPGVDDGPVWLTTPLAALAGVLAGRAGIDIEAVATVLAANRTTSVLRATGDRLVTARAELAGGDDVDRAVLDVVKVAYAGATAWFEHSGAKPPAPLARPDWRHTLIERAVANTWRTLAAASPAPFAWCDVDTALFALNDPTDHPFARRGSTPGAWKPKGTPMPMAIAGPLIADGAWRELLAGFDQ